MLREEEHIQPSFLFFIHLKQQNGSFGLCL